MTTNSSEKKILYVTWDELYNNYTIIAADSIIILDELDQLALEDLIGVSTDTADHGKIGGSNSDNLVHVHSLFKKT